MKKFRQHLEESLVLAYHNSLNPKIWNGDKLSEEVRNKLLLVGETFLNFCKIDKKLLFDIQLTGSQANFNYTGYSDIDVHLIVNTHKIFDGGPFIENYLKTKKTLWSLTHNITIRGYPIEVYVQDINETEASSGIYSLTQNKWLKHPVHGNFDFSNDTALISKVEDWKNQIDHLIKTDASEEAYEMLYNKMFDMRHDALKDGNEMSFSNLVYKEIRNQGYVTKLRKAMIDSEDKSLSLESKGLRLECDVLHAPRETEVIVDIDVIDRHR